MIIAYAYEAALHCPDCAYERFGENLENAIDNEGNEVTPIFSWNELHIDGPDSCDDCFEIFD